MKHYLIDSENVGDFWIPLLDIPAEQAELIVFYTNNSPHMSYDSLIKLKESDRKVTFIKCYEGTNALDFQLCSELGFLIAGSPSDEFIIVTNDTGYDAAVKYWRRKEYSVKRIAGKDSRTGSRRRGTPVRFDVAAEVSAILHKLTKAASQDIAAAGEMTEAEDENEEFSASALQEEAEPETEFVEEQEPDEEPESEEMEETEEEPGDYEEDPEDYADDSEDYAEDSGDDEGGLDMTEDPDSEEPEETLQEEEFAGEEEEDPQALFSESTSQDAPDLDPEEESETQESVIEDEETSQLPAETENEQDSETEAEDAAAWETGSAQETTDASDDGEEAESFTPDPDEITAIVNCIGMDNLAELHNQLIQFYGDNGKDIYLSLKANTLPIEKKGWDKEEKFLYYCALIFRHSDEPAEELTEENISEFASFLLGAENKRKNLNSLRYALLKHYGKEKGRRYYFMLKPYVKALNQM